MNKLGPDKYIASAGEDAGTVFYKGSDGTMFVKIDKNQTRGLGSVTREVGGRFYKLAGQTVDSVSSLFKNADDVEGAVQQAELSTGLEETRILNP